MVDILEENLKTGNNLKKLDKSIFIWLFSLLLLLPWAFIKIENSLNSNTAWLTLCAKRIFNGGSMLHDCYDTNPPLSIIIHIPPVLLENITGIASYYWIYIITFAMCIYATVITYHCLRALNWLSKERTAIFSITFLAASTILAGLAFSDRDQLTSICFLPFILIQTCITERKKVSPSLSIPFLLLGSIMILIKPYYGLLPSLLLLHRVYKFKSIKAFLKPDFFILCLTTAFYIAITLTYFYDYIIHIAPDVLILYAPYTEFNTIWTVSRNFGITAILSFFALLLMAQKQEYRLYILLLLCVANGLLAFTLQLKGFSYHLLPTMSSLSLLFVLIFFGAIRALSSEKISNHIFTHLSILVFIFICFYAYKQPNAEYLSHEQYTHNIITKTLDRYCTTEPCSYFMTYDNMDIVSQISYYHKTEYASRFPTFWFCPMILQKREENNGQDPIEFATIKNKYFSYVAEDIKRFAPQILILITSEFCTDEKDEKQNPHIQSFMQKYQHVDTINIDRAFFYKKTKYDFPYPLKWDVYTLKNTKNSLQKKQ